MLRRPAAATLVVAGLLVASMAGAQVGDTEPAVSADSLEKAGRFDGPTWVMLRSLLVPGWGQLKNGSWLKALLVAGTEAAFIERLAFENRLVHEYRRKKERNPERADFYQAKVVRHKNHRRDFIWWTSMFVVLAMGEAYVDAHLHRFDVRLQAEPESEEQAGQSGVTLRLGIALRL